MNPRSIKHTPGFWFLVSGFWFSQSKRGSRFQTPHPNRAIGCWTRLGEALRRSLVLDVGCWMFPSAFFQRSYRLPLALALLLTTAIARVEPLRPVIDRYEGTDAVYNDPKLAERLRAPLEAALGKNNVVIEGPISPSEDFSVFVEQGVPGFYFSLGGADPEKYAQAKASGTLLPSNHSPFFAPDVDPALHTVITAEIGVLRNLLNLSPEQLHKLIDQQAGN